MARDPEAIGHERIQAAGFRPLEPFPGLTTHWRLECTTCGRDARLVPKPSLKPCIHCATIRSWQEPKQTPTAEETEPGSRWPAILIEVRTRTLEIKNLRALEPHPGDEGLPWWVVCKYCGLAWHMPEDRLRACPHRGTGDPGHPPIPDTKKRRTTKPSATPAVDTTDLTGLDLQRIAHLEYKNGHWVLAVSPFLALITDDGDHHLRLLETLDGDPAQPPTQAAEELLRAAGWTTTSLWSTAPGEETYLMALLTTDAVVTEYQLGRDVLGSVAQKPEIPGRTFARKVKLHPAGVRRDSKGREHNLYLKAEARGAHKIEEARKAHEEEQQ